MNVKCQCDGRCSNIDALLSLSPSLSPSAMDKSDLLVHVQKLSMKLEEERAKATEGVAKMRRRVSKCASILN